MILIALSIALALAVLFAIGFIFAGFDNILKLSDLIANRLCRNTRYENTPTEGLVGVAVFAVLMILGGAFITGAIMCRFGM